MILWEKYVYERIEKLASTDPTRNVKRTKDDLCAAWNARVVDFLDPNAQPIHGKTLLSNLLRNPFTVRVELEFPCAPVPEGTKANEDLNAKDVGRGAEPIPVSTDGATPQDRPRETFTPQPRRVDPLVERVVSSLDAQERRRSFVWAGFVVKELLPGIGIEVPEAQVLFDRLVDSGVLLLEKRPNPNNPDFQTTCVKLNRENETVRTLLNENGVATKAFQPVPIRGETASATLIRERR